MSVDREHITEALWQALPHYRRKDLWMVSCTCCKKVRIVDIKPGPIKKSQEKPGLNEAQARRLARYMNEKSEIKKQTANMNYTRGAVIKVVRRYALRNKIPIREAFGALYIELNKQIGGKLYMDRKNGQKTIDLVAEKGLLGQALEIAKNMDFTVKEGPLDEEQNIFSEEYIDQETGEIIENSKNRGK